MKQADIQVGEFYGVTSKIQWDKPTYVSGRKAQVIAVGGGKVTVRYDGSDRDSTVRTVDVKAPWAEFAAKQVEAQAYATRQYEARLAASERARLADEAWARVAPDFNAALAAVGITGVQASQWRSSGIKATPESLALLAKALKEVAA
jgi:hypothetical protein